MTLGKKRKTAYSRSTPNFDAVTMATLPSSGHHPLTGFISGSSRFKSPKEVPLSLFPFSCEILSAISTILHAFEERGKKARHVGRSPTDSKSRFRASSRVGFRWRNSWVDEEMRAHQKPRFTFYQPLERSRKSNCSDILWHYGKSHKYTFSFVLFRNSPG